VNGGRWFKSIRAHFAIYDKGDWFPKEKKKKLRD